MDHVRFSGFSAGLFQFLSALAENNTREWFDEQRRHYQSEVLTPVKSFVADLGPIIHMLNEAFDSFSHSVDAGDREPTKPQMDVFASLSGRLDEQLKKWNAIKQDDLPKVTELIKQADLPALIVKEKKTE